MMADRTTDLVLVCPLCPFRILYGPEQPLMARQLMVEHLGLCESDGKGKWR